MRYNISLANVMLCYLLICYYKVWCGGKIQTMLKSIAQVSFHLFCLIMIWNNLPCFMGLGKSSYLSKRFYGRSLCILSFELFIRGDHKTGWTFNLKSGLF